MYFLIRIVLQKFAEELTFKIISFIIEHYITHK